MLNKLTRKLCPLMSLAALACGCGKKAAGPQTTESNSTRESAEPASTVQIELDSAESFKKLYTFARDGIFQGLPTSLRVKLGNAKGAKIIIYYNVEGEEANDTNFEFKCVYQAAASSTTEIPLAYCSDRSSGGRYSDVANSLNPMRRDTSIQVELRTYSGHIILNANYNIEWK